MDGFQVPESAQQLGNTVLVAVGQTRAVEFVADNPGDWAMHLPYDPPHNESNGA